MVLESMVGLRNKVRVHKRRMNVDLKMEVSPAKHNAMLKRQILR